MKMNKKNLITDFEKLDKSLPVFNALEKEFGIESELYSNHVVGLKKLEKEKKNLEGFVILGTEPYHSETTGIYQQYKNKCNSRKELVSIVFIWAAWWEDNDPRRAIIPGIKLRGFLNDNKFQFKEHYCYDGTYVSKKRFIKEIRDYIAPSLEILKRL